MLPSADLIYIAVAQLVVFPKKNFSTFRYVMNLLQALLQHSDYLLVCVAWPRHRVLWNTVSRKSNSIWSGVLFHSAKSITAIVSVSSSLALTHIYTAIPFSIVPTNGSNHIEVPITRNKTDGATSLRLTQLPWSDR